MTLAGAYHEHRGPLRASLRAAFGIDLREPGMDLSDLADHVEGLPPGCALWRATGGPMALSMEVHALIAVAHRGDILAWQNTGIMSRRPRGKQPQPPADPPYTAEVEAQKRKAESKRERAIARRQRPRVAGE